MARTDLTVVYYTSQQEGPVFESRIQQTLRENIGDLPLISVSQQPLSFGQNICVGQVGCSSQNAWRQLQIGVEAARTQFVCPAESDIIHPPGYFDFVPPRDDTFYFADPLWVFFAQRGYAHVYCLKHRGSEAAMFVNRDLLLRRLQQIMHGLPQWGDLDADGEKLPFLTTRRKCRIETFQPGAPTVTFKTDAQMHQRTPHDVNSKTRELPHWGPASTLWSRYFEP